MGGAAQPVEDAAAAAADVIGHRGATSSQFTGRWLDPRNAMVGVGILEDGDDEEVRTILQALVPAGIEVRVRLVSSEWVRLHQV